MKKTLKIAGLFTLLLGTTGCVANLPQEEAVVLGEGQVGIFCVSEETETLVQEAYQLEETSAKAQAAELYEALMQQPEKLGYRCAIPQGIELLDVNLDGEQFTMYFNDAYYTMDSVSEVLCRAAIVKTMVQVEGIDGVEFMVSNQPLVDKAGRTIGLMTGDTFLESTGSEFNSYQETELNLYFSNTAGDGLVLVKRKLLYNTNIPMEKLVVEQLLKGIEGEESSNVARAAISEDVSLLKLYVRDGVCYVNFDEKFLTQNTKVNEEIMIYSLVNSLTELPNITKVQISVNGVSNTIFKEKINLNTMFEKDMSYLQ